MDKDQRTRKQTIGDKMAKIITQNMSEKDKMQLCKLRSRAGTFAVSFHKFGEFRKIENSKTQIYFFFTHD